MLFSAILPKSIWHRAVLSVGLCTVLLASSASLSSAQAATVAQAPTDTEDEDALRQADALMNQAFSLYQAGHYSAAIPLVEQVIAIRLQILGLQHASTANSINNLALLYRSQGNYEEAETLYRQALEIYEATVGPESAEVANSLNNVADMYREQGRYEESERLHQTALEISKQIFGPDHPETANILNNMAGLYEAQGRYAEAETLHQRALTIREQTLSPNHPLTALSLNNLALIYQLQGRYSEAEPLYQQVLAIRKQALGSSHPSTATSLIGLGALYRLQGRYDEAEPLFQEALRIYEQISGPNHPSVALSLSNLAELYRDQGRYEEIEPLLQRALTITEEALGPDHPDMAIRLNNLATLYQAQGRFNEVEPLLQRTLLILEQTVGPNHPHIATSLNNLAAVYSFQERYEEAEFLYQWALDLTEQVLGPTHPATAVTLGNIAVLHWSQNQFDQVRIYLSQGLQAEEAILQQNLVGGSDANKQDYLATVTETAYAAISLHLNELPRDSAAAYLALTTVLQRKGRILDLFTNLRTQLRDDPDALALFDELNAASTQLAALSYSEGEVDIDLAQISTLQTRIRDLEDALSRRSSEFADLTASPNLEEVQATLPADTALIEFMRYRPFDPTNLEEQLGDYRYAAYILQPNGRVQGLDLGPAAAIEAAVDTLSTDLARPDTPLFQVVESAQAVDALVMAPVRAALGDTTTVFLSPDGALNRMPFEALANEAGEYLVERYQFRYLTSGRDLLRLDNAAVSTNSAVVMGNPNYGSPGALVAEARSIDFASRRFPALPGTQGEVDQIAAKLPSARVYTSSNATETVVKQQVSPSILHIATHGYFEPTANALNPLLQSGLVLAGAGAGGQSGPDQDGLLSALEVTGIDLNGTQLAVLSACETGLGALAAGEGLYGLRRALVLAGAQSQVISLWKVNDTATQALMVAYYDNLLAGMPRDQALRQTQLAFLQDDAYSHPYYWAAFIASGDWRPLQEAGP